MIRAKKKFGQNFLTDKNILDKIVRYTTLSDDDTVIEIGTGHGALTRELDARARSVLSYEIDKDLCQLNLTRLTPQLHRTQLIQADFLDAPFPIPSAEKTFKVIANIPYNITTPIIEKLITNRHHISSIFLMVQKELADRLAASPGNKDYGSFTIFVDYFCQVKKLFNVSRTCFRPIPKVDSAVISITPRSAPKVDVSNEKLFFDVMHAAFWGRRKTLNNSLKKYGPTSPLANLIAPALQACNIEAQIRGERLSIEQFAALANTIDQLQQISHEK